ncbi:MAG TPA: IS630 family transposase, partial [Candidatus Dormibacteraeota bacterium]
ALETAIKNWIQSWNGHPRPFIWVKTADEILESVAEYCQRISGSAH